MMVVRRVTPLASFRDFLKGQRRLFGFVRITDTATGSSVYW